MRRPLFAALILGLSVAHVCGASGRTPFQARCEDELNKTVSVLTAQQGGYTIDNHLPYRALTAMKGAARANAYVLGLTKTESRVALGLDGSMLQDPASGYECVVPRLTVKLAYAPIVIYIGREFAPGSCAYDEILAHEMRHMQTYLDHLPRAEAVVRDMLLKRFDSRPLYARSGSAKAALAREVNNSWMPYIKGEIGKVEVQQRAIDSPEEYRRLSSACNGEIQEALKRGRRER